MPFRINNVPRMEEIVDDMIYGHIDSRENISLVFANTNYDCNGFVLDFDNDGIIEWEILAVYMTETSVERNGVIGYLLNENYIRIDDLPSDIRDSILNEISCEDYSPVN